MARIRAECSDELKAAFASAAQRIGLSEGALVRQMVAAVIGVEVHPKAAAAPLPSGKLTIRLTQVERDAVATHAAAEGKTIPRWVKSLIRRCVLRLPQFAESELDALKASVKELRAVGTNLNATVHFMRRSGRFEPSMINVEALAQSTGNLRRQLLATIDKASNRYEVPEESIDES